MSCGCNSTPCCCSGSIAPAICCTPSTESVEYTFENQNLIGIGVYNGEADNLVGFRGIASDTLALTVTLDAPNNAIIISFNDELLIDDIPDADETTRGILEVATQAETNAGAVDNKIITPLKLATMQATETQTGVLQIATQAEVTTGTNDATAVSPLKLATFAGTQLTTRVFADAVARAAAVPAFDGQLGVQLDTNALVMATSTIAGGFNISFTILGDLTVGASITTGIINATEANVSGFVVNGAGINVLAPLSFEVGTEFQISGAPATNSVIIGRALGAADALPIADFLSTENVQTGWGTPSGTLARTTFASYAGQTVSNPPTQAEMQTLDDAVVIVSRRLAALVTDLLAVNLPSA